MLKFTYHLNTTTTQHTMPIQYKVINAATAYASEPMTIQMALDLYDSLGGNRGGFKVVQA